MFKKISLLISICLFSFDLYALTISVNGSVWKTETLNSLTEKSFSILLDSKPVSAVSLDELFPAVYEAWKMELNGSTTTVIRDPNLGDELSRLYLIRDNNGWALKHKSDYYTEIDAINLECDPIENGSLEIWVNWEGIDLLREEINRYAEAHDVEIRITEVPKPDSKLITRAQSRDGVPDIVMVQSSYIDRLAKSEALQNLDYMYPPGMRPMGREAFSLDGHVWAVPFYYDAQLIFCNPELVDIPDFNWDLDDFEALCLSAKNKGIIPAAWNSYSASFLIPFQMAFGKKRLVEPDGGIIINDRETAEALEYVLYLQNRGLMQPMERDAMTSLFVSGETAMIISASYSIPHFINLGIPFEAVPLPFNGETGIRVSPLLDFKAFAIPKRSRNTVGARRLIEYLCGTGVQQRFTSATAKLPANESAWYTAENENPWYEALSLSSAGGTVIPTEKAYSIYKNTMWKMLRFAISGRMPVQQVLDKTQELVDKNIEDRN